MGKKATKYKPPEYKFDTTITYIIPMLPVGAKRAYDNEFPVECKITQDPKTGVVRADKEGFQSKWFEDMYFDWLMYTKYVRKAE